MWAPLAQNRGSVQDRQTNFMLQSRALVMEAVTGSSCGNPFTGPASTAVWKGWVISRAALLGETCNEMTSFHSRVLGGCSTLCVLTSKSTPASRRCCSCMLCLIALLLRLPLVRRINTPRFFLRSSVQIHSCKCNEGLWERAGTHE